MTQHVYATLSWASRMLAVWCGLLGWQWAANRLECLSSVLFVLPLWGILTLAASELALLKRHAFINQYLKPQGVLAWLWRRKTVLLLWQGIKSLFFGLLLIVSAVLFDVVQWLVLLVDVVLMITLVHMITWILRDEVKSSYQEPLARHWAHWVNAVLLWLIFVLIMFFTAHENYQGMAWEEVVHFTVAEVYVSCDVLAVLARINAVSEALMWWAAQNRLGTLENPTHVLLAWIVFVASFGVSFLIAWAYSRALIGVLAKPWQIAVADDFSTETVN